MLRRLTVENYALIDRLELELDAGLNIITGETGAGKSILLGALGLLLGAKNEGAALRDPGRTCLVEGTFDLTGLGLEGFFAANDLDYAPESVFTRQITPAGKSRSFVNDTPAPLTVLRELGERLIDIHSQHQNLILSDERFRIRALDTVAGSLAMAADYRAEYDRWGALKRELAHVRERAAEARRDEEWLRHQTGELAAAHLKPGEQTELEAELSVLSNADRIVEALGGLTASLDDEETGVFHRLKASEAALKPLAEGFPFAEQAAARLRSTLEELKDLGSEATARLERLDADPARVAALDARLNTIYTLTQKHRAHDLDELLAIQGELEARLAAVDGGGEAVAALEAQTAAAQAGAEKKAAALHEKRAAAAHHFGEQIRETLTALGMPEARFEVQIEPAPLNDTGADAVDFLFTAGGKFPPREIERIASGGELSRVMLALKSLLARHTQLPTILFDEIDTGVSGHIADAMGAIIARLSTVMQVVDITHLPQVASKGRTHFVVYKDAAGSHIRRLTPGERTEQIARMLSGARVTDAALAQAEILLTDNEPQR